MAASVEAEKQRATITQLKQQQQQRNPTILCSLQTNKFAMCDGLLIRLERLGVRMIPE